MNGHYRMRVLLWHWGVGRGLLTPEEAQAVERLWTLEETGHRRRWSL